MDLSLLNVLTGVSVVEKTSGIDPFCLDLMWFNPGCSAAHGKCCLRQPLLTMLIPILIQLHKSSWWAKLLQSSTFTHFHYPVEWSSHFNLALNSFWLRFCSSSLSSKHDNLTSSVSFFTQTHCAPDKLARGLLIPPAACNDSHSCSHQPSRVPHCTCSLPGLL